MNGLGADVRPHLQVELLQPGFLFLDLFLIDHSDAVNTTKRPSVRVTPQIVATCLVNRSAIATNARIDVVTISPMGIPIFLT